MAPLTGKRKRVQSGRPEVQDGTASKKKTKQTAQPHSHTGTETSTSIQIVTGDYERVLHGLTATVSTNLLQKNDSGKFDTHWTETFLFSAHTASIRCLAISPEADNGKRFLATGSADERINVYSISGSPPVQVKASANKPSLNGNAIAENASNKSLGSLNNHDRAITRLHFPTKGKLFSSAEDNTVAISRTRDWTMLSSIKAPIPKIQGRPSGDTAAPGEVPTGVNDFAIHPSQKLMLSVCRGERCMRLWNLMTGKKAGVLNFDRELLTAAGENKFSSGEGRRVLWNATGEQYIVGFERGAVVFGIDSKPRAIIKPPSTPTKFHQYRVLPDSENEKNADLLAISTEDGRVLTYDLSLFDSHDKEKLPRARCIAQIGGRSQDITSRIKDFEILALPPTESSKSTLVVVSAGSDGTLWLWHVNADELHIGGQAGASLKQPKQIGRLIGRHSTDSRITCLGAFVMDAKPSRTIQKAADAPSGDESASEEQA